MQEKPIKKGILAEITERHVPFLFAFLGVFLLTLFILSVVGLTPVPPAEIETTGVTAQEVINATEGVIAQDTSVQTAPVQTVQGAPVQTPTSGGGSASGQRAGTTGASVPFAHAKSGTENPIRIVAKTVSLDGVVSNPTSSDANVLDQALLSSVVRYPGSAFLGEDGNMVIFGHSSYLKVVHNQSFKAFNDIQKLKVGETIVVYSATTAYEYRVTAVKYAKAENFVIDLSTPGRHLTLVTCNSFATKSDRYVIEAEFVTSYAAAN